MTKLISIEGIGEVYDAKLKEIGIQSVESLLKKGATPKGRKDLAAASGISDTLILEWVNRADLFRIKGVGEEYSDLLEASGVDTVVELAKRRADNLYAKMVEVNGEKKLVRQLPTQTMVESWIEHAKQLPRIVSY